MDVQKKDERRKHSRVGFATRITVRLESGAKAVSLEANSRDLSLKGIFVRTPERFPLDTGCVVDIYLTGGVDEIRLEVKGRTVRQTDDGVGIVFESMDVDTYTHLKNIVYYNSTDDSL